MSVDGSFLVTNAAGGTRCSPWRPSCGRAHVLLAPLVPACESVVRDKGCDGELAPDVMAYALMRAATSRAYLGPTESEGEAAVDRKVAGRDEVRLVRCEEQRRPSNVRDDSNAAQGCHLGV